MSLNAERIQVTGGPWPGRVGCRGRIVEFEPSRRYPTLVYPWAALNKDEVVVLLDFDPIDSGDDFGRTWSCVLPRAAVIILS